MVSKHDIATALGAGLTGTADAAKFIRLSGQVGPDYGAVGANGVDAIILIAPYPVRLTEFLFRVKTVESADGTIDVEKVPSGTALGSGDDMVTQYVPTAAGGLTADTNEPLVINTDGTQDMDTGDMCVIKVGTIGELTAISWMACFERLV